MNVERVASVQYLDAQGEWRIADLAREDVLGFDDNGRGVRIYGNDEMEGAYTLIPWGRVLEVGVEEMEMQKCEGPCGKLLPITKFPTLPAKKVGGVGYPQGRGKVCRADVAAARAEKKAAKNKDEVPT